MSYNQSHEAKACVNELYYRDGPQPKDIRLEDAEYVQEVIQRYLQEAYSEGLKAAKRS